MPGNVGLIFIYSNQGEICTGFCNRLAPRVTGSSYRGAGCFNIGDLLEVVNSYNETKVNDNDIIDQADFLNL